MFLNWIPMSEAPWISIGIFDGHLPVDVKDNIYAMAFEPFMKDMGHG